MRNIITTGVLIVLLCVSICPLNVQAKEHSVERLDLELDVISVRELELDGVMPNANNGGVYKSIEVVYNGTITPSTTYTYEYTSNNIRYSGNLSLASYSHKNGTTIATYDGYTYPMN